MPDTLMLPFERPGDAVIRLLRALQGGSQYASLLMEAYTPEAFWAAHASHLIRRKNSRAYISPLGRLVLAACAPDAPDPVGRVVEAARLVRHNYHRPECCIDPKIVDVLIQRLNELDRATGKAGEVG